MSFNTLLRQFGKAIRDCRIAKALRQEELAERAMISLSTLKRMENPSSAGNQRLSDYLKALAIVNPRAMQRLLVALDFNPSDHTSDPIDGLVLAEKIRTKERVRHLAAGMPPKNKRTLLP